MRDYWPNPGTPAFGTIHAVTRSVNTSGFLTRLRNSTRFGAGAALLLTIALGTAACATKRISNVLDDPYKYRNEDVQISGRVVDAYSIGSRGAYRVADRSGQLWVVSDEGVPRRGADVTVEGTVRDALNLGPLGSLLKLPATGAVVMIESDRRVK